MSTLVESSNSIWKYKRFSTLFISAFFVAFAAKIYDLALPLLVFELTQSATMMGWMRAVEFLPNLLLAVFIGILVDRFDKKTWSQVMLLGQVIVVLLSYIAVQWLEQPLYMLFPCAFLMMLFNYGYGNARMIIIKNTLPHELQNTATARVSSLYSFMETVGPVLSGVLLLFAAIHYVFIVVALLLVLAYWQLQRLDISEVVAPKQDPLWQSLQSAWLLLIRDRNMWYITLAVMVINTTGSVFWIQAIYFAKAQLALDAVEVGYFIAASGIGGLFGSFTADKVRQRMGLGWLLIGSIALESLGFIMPLFSPGIITLALAFFWISAVGLFSNICIWSYRQEAFSADHLGRIAGITGSLFKLLMPFGLVGSGYLVMWMGIEQVFILCFGLQLLVAIVLMLSRVRCIA